MDFYLGSASLLLILLMGMGHATRSSISPILDDCQAVHLFSEQALNSATLNLIRDARPSGWSAPRNQNQTNLSVVFYYFRCFFLTFQEFEICLSSVHRRCSADWERNTFSCGPRSQPWHCISANGTHLHGRHPAALPTTCYTWPWPCD